MADIRLRNINKEYILKRIEETSSLEQEIADLQDIVNRPERVKEIIISELANVKKKYAVPRRTALVYEHALESSDPEEDIPDYPVNVFLSREGYFKKITPQSLRMSSEQKYKEGDGAFLSWECGNRDELLVFTDKQQCYKTRMSDFDDAKASVLGDYLPTKLGFDEGESFVWACIPGDYSGNLLFFFQNGKAARVELSGYQTQTRRKRLTGAYSDKSPLVTAYLLREEMEMAVWSTEGPRPDLPHRLPCPESHPLYPGGQHYDAQAQIPAGGCRPAVRHPYPKCRPLSGAFPCLWPAPAQGGGPGRGADVPDGTVLILF